MKLVSLPQQTSVHDELIALAEHAEAMEFKHMMWIGINPDGEMHIGQVGRAVDTFEMIGIMNGASMHIFNMDFQPKE
jgi:hypothetical protein